MKSFLPLVAGVLLALVTLSTASAARNTASGNYRVDAALTAGGPQLEGRADVFVLDADGDVVARRHAVPAVLDLSPGDYTAVVVYKNARGRATLTESTRPGTNVVNLEAGEVRFELVTKTGALVRVSDASWTVYRYRAGSHQGKEVAVTQARRPQLTLDAGWYEVRVRYGATAQKPSSETHVVEVDAGRRQTYSIVAE